MQGAVSSDDEPCALNRQAQIAADAALCLQLHMREEQQVGALNAASIAPDANTTLDDASTASAGTCSSAAAHVASLNCCVKTTGSKADRKAVRQPLHNAARKIQVAARARLASLRAEEEARFQSEMHQALRESVRVAPSAGTSSPAATITACVNALVSVHSTASFTDAASTAAAIPARAATPAASTATLAPAVAPTASSINVAPSTAAVSAAAGTITATPTPTAAALASASLVPSTMIAATLAPAARVTALTKIASPASVRSPRQSQQLLPQGTYLPPCSMAVAMGPWGQQFLHWNMLSQPVPHKRGEPTHFNAQNEPVNARGKSYVPPPPPGPRGCNGGSHKSWMKREKEKAKRQQKRAATGQ